MRKAFRFFRSYYDVANLLTDEDRLNFYDALMKRQFTGEETELTNQARFAYVSQKHSIDKQVSGYEDKTGCKLTPMQGPTVGGSVGGYVGPMSDPRQQVQEKEKEKEKEQLLREFELFWNAYSKKNDREKCIKAFTKLSDSDRQRITEVVENYVRSTPDIQYRKNPLTWLNGKCWNDEIIIKAKTKSEFANPII